MPSCLTQPLQRRIVLMMIVALGLLIYSNTLKSPFFFDDSYILNKRQLHITHLTVRDILKAGFFNARPVANISFSLNYYVHGFKVSGYHAVNIVIHIINASLLLLLIQATLKTPVLTYHKFNAWIAYSTVLLWFVNPLHTQSVTYIIQRMNSLAAMFYLLSFFLYVKARIQDNLFLKIGCFGGCLGTGFLALGSKEIAATLPFFILLYEWFFFQNLQFRHPKLLFFVISGLIFFFAVIAATYTGTEPWTRISKLYTKHDFTMTQRVLTEFRVVFFYISLLLYPHPSRLNLDHDFPLSYSLLNPPTTLTSMGAVIGLLGAAIYLARKERLIAFSILWFFGNLVIESSVLGLAIIFEHRSYTPSMFVSLLFVVLLFRYFKSQRIRLVVLFSLLLICSVWTYERNKIWSDEVVFWRDCLKKSPNKARPHNNLGFALIKRGKRKEALPHFYQAVRIKPDYAEAHTNLGSAMVNMGRLDEGIKHYKAALRIDSDHENAYFNLGVVLYRNDKLQEAIYNYRMALLANPDHYLAHNYLGVALQHQGKRQEALENYREALRIKPDYKEAGRNQEVLLRKMDIQLTKEIVIRRRPITQ